jgi:hypothetical protein
MLLSKKEVHLLFSRNKQKYFMELFTLLYSILRNQSSFFLSHTLYYCGQYRIRALFTQIFHLKVNVASATFLNVILARLYNSFSGLLKIGFDIKTNTYNKNQKDYTVLRSPFVHKKTREQLLIMTTTATIFISINIHSIILVEYLIFLLYKKTCFVSGTRLLVIKKKAVK